ncbi:MAG TPA: hypothetical protein VGB18_02255, partial [Candidatus Thermoplasmatota archaeon]
MVVGVLLSASLVMVAAQAGLGTGSFSSVEPFSVAVPSGRIGDEALYARFDRAEAPDPWRPIGSVGFRVESTRTMMDDHLRTRRVLQVDWQASSDALQRSELLVDLATRDVVRRGHPQDWEYDFQEWSYDFGPMLDSTWSVVADSSLFRFAGTPLTVGEDLSDALGVGFANAWGLHPDAYRLTEFRATVTNAAVIADVTGVQVEIRGSVTSEAVARSGLQVSASDDRHFLSFEVPAEATVDFVRRSWWCSCSPYPLRMEDAISVD